VTKRHEAALVVMVALALHFREITAQWIAAYPEKVRREDPPLNDRERFGFQLGVAPS
jgi:hypothetical protein